MSLIEGMDNMVLFVFLMMFSCVCYVFWLFLTQLLKNNEITSTETTENSSLKKEKNPRYEHDHCGICIREFKDEVSFICGHNFCCNILLKKVNV